MTENIERLAENCNTVGVFWHDAYAKWQVKLDPQRRTFDDCRFEGWGDTLDEAVREAAAHLRRPTGTGTL